VEVPYFQLACWEPAKDRIVEVAYFQAANENIAVVEYYRQACFGFEESNMMESHNLGEDPVEKSYNPLVALALIEILRFERMLKSGDAGH
jgi:hypothetical protein